MKRRNFLQTLAAAGASAMFRTTAGSLLLSTLSSQQAYAKPGGHRMMKHMCKSVFDVHHNNIGRVELFLGGTGFASYGIDSVIRETDVASLNVISMEWESNHVSTLHPKLGLICCNGLVKGKSDTPSTVVLYPSRTRDAMSSFPTTLSATATSTTMSGPTAFDRALKKRELMEDVYAAMRETPRIDRDVPIFSARRAMENRSATVSRSPAANNRQSAAAGRTLPSPAAVPGSVAAPTTSTPTALDPVFPALMMNRLHFEMELPGIGLTMFNKEPMILLGEVGNLDEEFLGLDPLIKKYPAGRPKNLKIGGVEPFGVHSLQAPVPFLNSKNPDQVVATLVATNVVTSAHYGLEVTLLSSKVDGALITAVFQIKNLLPREQTIMWFADDSYHLQIVSKPRSEPLTLTDKPIEVQVQAINSVRDKMLDRKSCIFMGCNSLVNNYEDFTSGFGYTDGDMLLGLVPTGPNW